MDLLTLGGLHILQSRLRHSFDMNPHNKRFYFTYGSRLYWVEVAPCDEFAQDLEALEVSKMSGFHLVEQKDEIQKLKALVEELKYTLVVRDIANTMNLACVVLGAVPLSYGIKKRGSFFEIFNDIDAFKPQEYPIRTEAPRKSPKQSFKKNQFQKSRRFTEKHATGFRLEEERGIIFYDVNASSTPIYYFGVDSGDNNT